MNIGKESLSTSVAGQGTVGTSELPLTPNPIPVAKHVVVKASHDNSNWITLGPRGHAVDGYPLAAGEETPLIYVDSTDKVGIVAGGANQHYSYVLS
jgi:hypothetical protein